MDFPEFYSSMAVFQIPSLSIIQFSRKRNSLSSFRARRNSWGKRKGIGGKKNTIKINKFRKIKKRREPFSSSRFNFEIPKQDLTFIRRDDITITYSPACLTRYHPLFHYSFVSSSSWKSEGATSPVERKDFHSKKKNTNFLLDERKFFKVIVYTFWLHIWTPEISYNKARGDWIRPATKFRKCIPGAMLENDEFANATEYLPLDNCPRNVCFDS